MLFTMERVRQRPHKINGKCLIRIHSTHLVIVGINQNREPARRTLFTASEMDLILIQKALVKFAWILW